MSCCCAHSRSAGRLFSWVARRYRKRFSKKGFERCQKQLMIGLARAGFSGATVLDIGCGVGHLHQSLLERGADSAVGIDLAPKMLAEARAWAADRGLSGRTQYVDGNFMELADAVVPADVTLLDKVVCCYPDADGLVHKSLARTRRVYGLIYPRQRWLTRFGAAAGGFFLWLIRSDFRPYIHDPGQIETWIIAEGFQKCFEDKTAIWLTQVYIRP